MTRSTMRPQDRELAGMLPLLYSTQVNYGWSAGMRAITHALLDDVELPDGPVLDVGCGGGALLAELAQRSPHNVHCGLERNGKALTAADSLAPSNMALVQADMMDIPYLNNTFSLCLALDSLDQRSVDITSALRECRRVLVQNGVLLLRVSAYPWLYGPHDIAFGTDERHRKADLLARLRREQFDVERATFANTLLGGPAALLRMLQRWRVAPFLPQLYTRNSLNRLLLRALSTEARYVHEGDLPMGLSFFIACRKRPSATGNEA